MDAIMGEKQALGEYLEEIRSRHPRLSRRRMALDAGLHHNAVQQIVSGASGARPKTLKAITDKWGTDDDYRRLMELSGHPIPKQ